MELKQIIFFVMFWAITDRFREVAVFEGWVSSIHEWFDTYYSLNLPSWFLFRTAYHTFKNLPVLFLFGLVWWLFGFWNGFYMAGTWGIGQWVGLLAARKGV